MARPPVTAPHGFRADIGKRLTAQLHEAATRRDLSPTSRRALNRVANSLRRQRRGREVANQPANVQPTVTQHALVADQIAEPTDNQSTGDQFIGDQSIDEQFTDEQPTGDQSNDDQSSDEQPTVTQHAPTADQFIVTEHDETNEQGVLDQQPDDGQQPIDDEQDETSATVPSSTKRRFPPNLPYNQCCDDTQKERDRSIKGVREDWDILPSVQNILECLDLDMRPLVDPTPGRVSSHSKRSVLEVGNRTNIQEKPARDVSSQFLSSLRRFAGLTLQKRLYGVAILRDQQYQRQRPVSPSSWKNVMELLHCDILAAIDHEELLQSKGEGALAVVPTISASDVAALSDAAEKDLLLEARLILETNAAFFADNSTTLSLEDVLHVESVDDLDLKALRATVFEARQNESTARNGLMQSVGHLKNLQQRDISSPAIDDALSKIGASLNLARRLSLRRYYLQRFYKFKKVQHNSTNATITALFAP